MELAKFHYPIDLHYSQTEPMEDLEEIRFHYPIDLHYSQTLNGTVCPIS